MGRMSKIKGAEFERKISHLLLEAAGDEFGPKDCFRTPGSGGHPFMGICDLMFSEKMAPLFPWCCELKHQAGLKLEQVLDMIVQIREFHEQVLKGAARDPLKRPPMVIMRGSGGNIYAMARQDDLESWSCCSIGQVAGMDYQYDGAWWRLVKFDELLDVVKVRAAERKTTA